LIIFGRDILAGFFGPDFASAELALAVLAVGQLINAATGPAGPILNMTGFERDTTLITLVAAVVAVVLSFALIPTWGVEGAAFAAAGSFASWNLLLSIQVYRRLGLHTTAFGLLGRLPLFSK
jgi:O-antigen/teichoic acid export membrane protein